VASSGPETLHPRIRDWISRQGWISPTGIQDRSWRELPEASDALLIAPTGTGKTEAVLLPLLSRRLWQPTPPVYLLYITPLRALNRDLEARIQALAIDLGLRGEVRHGDTPPSERTRQARSPPDILITTPETLQLLLGGKNLRQALAHLRCVVVDEIHELASSDRGAQLVISLDRLDDLCGRWVDRIGLSATVGNPEELGRFLSNRGRPVRILLSPEAKERTIQLRGPAPLPADLPRDLRQELRADEELLGAILTVQDLIREHRSTLVFVNTRPMAEGLAARLRRLDPSLTLAVHHGSLSRELRETAERDFRDGRLRALIATSSLELGIDIGVADFVIQFGSPHQVSRLIQRVGRAGHRRDRVSQGAVVALDPDDLEEATVLIGRAERGQVEEVRIRRPNRLAVVQQLVALLRTEGGLPLTEAHRRLTRSFVSEDLALAEFRELVGLLDQLRVVRLRGDHLARGRATLERFYATLTLIPEERTYVLRDLGTRRPIGTLDERFVVTQVLARPDLTFLLQGQTWRVVEFREGELLVESVAELGTEPRWAGEDIPVPVEVAREMGALRRTRDLSPYPLDPPARERLTRSLERWPRDAPLPDDRTIVVERHPRHLVIGSCEGSRVNTTLATLLSGLATSRFGSRVEPLLVEPTWIVLGLPQPAAPEDVSELFQVAPEAVPELLRRLVPATLEYRWNFVSLARKFGVLPTSADSRNLRTLEPLLEAHRETLLGEETLAKTLHSQFDVENTQAVFRSFREGTISLAIVPRGEETPGREVLARLRWQNTGGSPPPTLLKAVRERLESERLLLVCVRCGFQRTVTPRSYREAGGSPCLVCHGDLSAVFSPRRPEEVTRFLRHLERKKRGLPVRRLSAEDRRRIAAAYQTADLLQAWGDRALLVLAARGVGPERATQILSHLATKEEILLTEILRAERLYAQTRAFWD